MTTPAHAWALLLFTRYKRDILSVIWRILKDHRQAADISQELYIRLSQADIGKYRSEQALVKQITHHICHDMLRQKYDRPLDYVPDMTDVVRDTAPDTADVIEANDEVQVLLRALLTLPRRQRQIFRMRKIHGMSNKEIARRLDLSENTIERHMGMAAKSFMLALGVEDHGKRGNGYNVSDLRKKA